ncbi:MAG: DUF503 domain-containing protein [Deltaproteobacteria bacterium]|jgi:uncharacterized protein YlxP (DUF503 family)|nr:DUF503 domain-containing protein [Deltaproteobacteria bacterium]
MVVGFLEVTLSMEGNTSLKDKRRVVKSLLGRVRSRFNASASEVGLADSHGTAILGFTVCGGDARVLGSVLDHLLNFIEEAAMAQVVDSRSECMRVG